MNSIKRTGVLIIIIGVLLLVTTLSVLAYWTYTFDDGTFQGLLPRTYERAPLPVPYITDYGEFRGISNDTAYPPYYNSLAGVISTTLVPTDTTIELNIQWYSEPGITSGQLWFWCTTAYEPLGGGYTQSGDSCFNAGGDYPSGWNVATLTATTTCPCYWGVLVSSNGGANPFAFIDWIRVEYSGGVYPTPTPIPTIPSNQMMGCNLDNHSFDDGLDDWEYGDWVSTDNGMIRIHGNGDILVSYIAQPIDLIATGSADYYEISISARSPVPVAPENASFLRWKLNSLIPGDDPDWYGGQALIASSDYYQHQSWILRGSNSPSISDTLTIWASGGGDIQIDSVCITLHTGPATATPICPPSPTYTPMPTYTPLATPTPVTTATATAWAATATAWPIPVAYPTQAEPNCTVTTNDPDWSFIWLASQILGFLGAFFEAIFKLLATLLQPIFDLFGFIIWLLGAALSLIARLIDLIGTALNFLLTFLEIAFDILEIIGAFFAALWAIITSPAIPPEWEIPSYFAWPIAAWNYLIADTPLVLLEPVAIAIGSLLMIVWTIRQFGGESS